MGAKEIAAAVALALGPVVKREIPKVRSRLRIWRDSEGWPMRSSRAAADIEPASKTARKYERSRKSI